MPSQPLTALIVETNFLIAAAIEALLADAGHTTLVATTPEEATHLLASSQIDVALIDFRLQHGDPDGLIHQLRGQNVPFVFCTAALSEEVAEVFPGARIIAKPFSDADLLAEIAALGRASIGDPDAIQQGQDNAYCRTAAGFESKVSS